MARGRQLSRGAERRGGLAELSTAQAFSERLSRELLAEGLVPSGPITVTLSASTPSGQLRSVSVRVEGFDPRSFPTRWQTHPVAVVTDRAPLAWEVGASTVVRDVTEVRRNHGWLQGLSDVPGDGPTSRDDGQAIVFVTVEGQRHEVPLVKTTKRP